MTRFATPVLLAVSAAAFVLSFPPYQSVVLPWVALVPLFVALRRAGGPAKAAGMAAVWGLFAAYGITAWLPRAIAGYWQQPFLLGLGLFVGASVLMGSLQYGLFALVCRWRAPGGWPSPLFVAAAWVAAELGRCRLFGGNPWGLMGYALAPTAASPPESWWRLPVQVADLGGVYAVSFVLVAFNSALVDLLTSMVEREPVRARRLGSGVVVAALVLGSALYGRSRLASVERPEGAGRDVAIVQGNVSLGNTWRPELYGRNFDVYLRGTTEALENSPGLVVWPENAMSFFPESEPIYRKLLARTVEGSAAQVLAGAPSQTDEASPRYFNSAFLFAPTGEIEARYDKEKLLPFSEHFPFGSISFLQRSFGRVREFTPGTRLAPLPTVAGRAGILICNEIMFDEIAVDRVRDGAEFLVNLSNDSWIGDRLYSLNHLAIGVIRAIETRRDLVRASTSGPSAFVDATGRLMTISPFEERAVLRGRVHGATEVTAFVRFGDLFAVLCLAGVVSAAGISRYRSRRDGRTDGRVG